MDHVAELEAWISAAEHKAWERKSRKKTDQDTHKHVQCTYNVNYFIKTVIFMFFARFAMAFLWLCMPSPAGLGSAHRALCCYGWRSEDFPPAALTGVDQRKGDALADHAGVEIFVSRHS